MKQIVKAFLLILLMSSCAFSTFAQDTKAPQGNTFSVPMWFVAALLYLVFLLITNIYKAKKDNDNTQNCAVLTILAGTWGIFLAATAWSGVAGPHFILSKILTLIAFLSIMFATFRANNIFQGDNDAKTYTAGYASIFVYIFCMFLVGLGNYVFIQLTESVSFFGL